MDKLPLSDITILDLTWVIAGPMATRLLCDLGARVIKVESRKSFDVLRSGCRRKGNDDPRKEGGWAFNDLNRGKTHITLNLKSEKGREVFEELVKISDVVVSNFGAAAFKKLRLTHEDLKEINSEIIVMNASGLGDWGPYSSFVTFAPILQSMTGIESLVGYEGADSPLGSFPPVADYMGSLAICNYLMAALEYRRRTGKGQFLDLSQGEAAVSYLGHILLDWQVNRVKRGLKGNHHYADGAAPHNVYKCLGDDEWCAISVASEKEWEAFAKTIDPPGEWTKGEKFSTAGARVANERELDERVSVWTGQKTANEVSELLQTAGVSGAPVQSSEAVLYEDEHLKERGFFKKIVFPPSDRLPDNFIVNGLPFLINGCRFSEDSRPAPEMGIHTKYVVEHILGKSEEWYNEAAAAEAFV